MSPVEVIAALDALTDDDREAAHARAAQLLADSDDYNDSLRIKGEAAEAGRLSKIETRP